MRQYAAPRVLAAGTKAPGGVHGEASPELPDAIAQEIPELIQASCLDALYDSPARSPPARCIPGTRLDVLERIFDWLIASKERILYISGYAGIGKSAISQTVAEICAERSVLAGTFFFLHTSPDRNTSEHLIPSIAYQLGKNIPHLYNHLKKIIQNHPSILHKNMRTQLKHLIIPLFTSTSPSLKTSKPFLIIIDGLDQCQETNNQWSILRSIGALATADIPLFFLLTSRPTLLVERDIVYLFGNIQRIRLHRSYGADPGKGSSIRDPTWSFRMFLEELERENDNVDKMLALSASTKQNKMFNGKSPDSVPNTAPHQPALDTELSPLLRSYSDTPQTRIEPHPTTHQEREKNQYPESPAYFSQMVTADLAFAHITAMEARLLETLALFGWEGLYLIQAGFNAQRLRLGQGILQEIYIFLESDLHTIVAKQLAAILEPFPVTIDTPIGRYQMAPSPPENESIWDFWSFQGVYQSDMESQLDLVDSENFGGARGKSVSQASGGSSNRGQGAKGTGHTPPQKSGESNDSGDHDGRGGGTGKSPVNTSIVGRSGMREVNVPFSSTLTQTNGFSTSSQFKTNACVEIKIEDNYKSESRPADSSWGGPWFEVKMTLLDVEMQIIPVGRPEYNLDYSQIRFIASRSPSSVLNFTPSIIRAEEDNVKSKSEWNASKSIQAVISANPSVRLGLARGSTSGEERTQKRWEVVGHYLASDKNNFTGANQTTMIWKYTHNTAFYLGEARNIFETRPAATFGLSRTSGMCPCLEIEVVTCYSWSLQSRSFKLRDWLADLSKPKSQPPAFFNFLHQTTVAIDLEGVKSRAEWVVDLTADEEQTLKDLGKADKGVVKPLESNDGFANCQVSLQTALHGHIKLSEEQKRNARPLLESLRDTMNREETVASTSTGLLTPSTSSSLNPSLFG